MPTYRGGRHEHGQNYLTNRKTISQFVQLVAETTGPIVEIGPGQGSLTRPLEQLGRPLTAVEIDARQLAQLRGKLSNQVKLTHADFLTWRLPRTPHVIVGNVPFHLTTSILRKLLHDTSWEHSILLVQWEVARRRAGVGGASMMTAQWWPWIKFRVECRVPKSAFQPSPSVDGGILVMTRRAEPLVEPSQQGTYRQFVHDVFTGRGHGLAAILANLAAPQDARSIETWLAREGVQPKTLPKSLGDHQWAALFNLASAGGWAARRASSRRGRRK